MRLLYIPVTLFFIQCGGVARPSYTLGFNMDLKNTLNIKIRHLNGSPSAYFFYFFNLQGLHEWAQRKTNSKPLLKLEQLADALDRFWPNHLLK